MANGDAAAAQGFTVVASTDDIRLGYDAINRAADFAATRQRVFTAGSDSGMAALTGMKIGDLCVRTDGTGVTAGRIYRWYGTAWKLDRGTLDSTALNYPGTITNWNTDQQSVIGRDGQTVVLQLNLNLGTNGMAAGGTICGIPADFAPMQQTRLRFELYNGAFNSAWVIASIAAGTTSVKADAVGGNNVNAGLFGSMVWNGKAL